MIKFVKILEYGRPPRRDDTFQFYVDLGLQMNDPPTLHPGKLEMATPIAAHSPQRRARECISCPPHTTLIQTNLLREITFDLRKMCGLKEWKCEGSASVRKRFQEFFVSDRLPTKRCDLFFEAKSALSLAAKLSKTGPVTIVSHSFRMKLLEAFIKTQGEIEKTPELFGDYLKEGERTFAFGEGFEIEEDELESWFLHP